MMNFFKPKTQTKKTLGAVCEGTSTDLSRIPDEAFSGGMLGKGFAVIPESNEFFSPVNGRVESIASTRHAYTIQTEEGLDVLVHIGVDTVQLNGDDMEARVHEGQSVKVGDPLAHADLATIRERGYDPITAVLITNPEKITQIDFQYGPVSAGSTVMSFRVREKG